MRLWFTCSVTRTAVGIGVLVVAALVLGGIVAVIRPWGGDEPAAFASLPDGQVPALTEPIVDPPGSAERVSADEFCARRVVRSEWEPRPENAAANLAVPPTPVPTDTWGSQEADAVRDRVTGRFTGTTDEIIQWASCKWGFPADVTRAQAFQETGWRQSEVGDGGESFGILQIRSTAWPGTAPWSARSTAYNLDWSLALRRACVDGLIYDGVGRGDLWGCLGMHYSGVWGDAAAQRYAAGVREAIDQRPWEQWPSAGGSPPAGDTPADIGGPR
jgi:hypothetical protein